MNMNESQILWKCRSEEEVRFKAAALGVDADKWLDEFQILWNCGSEEEIRLKAATLGIDADAWLEANGFRWRQSFMWVRMLQGL